MIICYEHFPELITSKLLHFRFTTFNPAEYEWSEVMDRIKREHGDDEDVQKASHAELLAAFPSLVNDVVRYRRIACIISIQLCHDHWLLVIMMHKFSDARAHEIHARGAAQQ